MDEDIDDLSSSDDEQYFDIENQDNKVWLVKIPTFVAERWSSITEPGVELGSLRIYKQGIPNPTKQGELLQKIKLHIDNPDNEIPIPQNYNLTITNLASQNQFVFTESFEGKAVALAGKVEHEGILGPIVDADYRKIMQQRTKVAADQNSSRVAQRLSEKHAKHGSLLATSGAQWDKHLKKKVVLDKRERMDKGDLLNLIFKLFEIKENYSLKALGDKTKQPIQYLKEVLLECAVLHKKGPMAGSYALKEEYKQGIAE